MVNDAPAKAALIKSVLIGTKMEGLLRSSHEKVIFKSSPDTF
jgi:hypothetical protein